MVSLSPPFSWRLCLRPHLNLLPGISEPAKLSRITKNVVVCELKGPREKYPRVWKTRTRIGTISKAAKLVTCVKQLSNVKEEIYGALDSFIAWDLEFPLVTVKKALKTLENEQEWKRIIQVTKWMLSKGQGRTMGTYFTLLNALEQDERLEEAEELWNKIFKDNLDATPRVFFNKMISIYYKRDMHDKLFEIFADMEELGVKPNVAIVSRVGKVFQKLGMEDKYEKLMKKYPKPRFEYRYIRGKRVKVPVKQTDDESGGGDEKEANVLKDGDEVVSDEEENNQDGEFSGEEDETEFKLALQTSFQTGPLYLEA